MKAACYSRYGPPEVVEIRDVPTPVPKDNEVLIRVQAATVSAGDWRMRRANPAIIRLMTGLRRPRRPILGMEFAGTIESVGPAVTNFHPGDVVFGGTGFAFGTHAEYVCLAADGNVAFKPQNLSVEESAAIMFGGMTALDFLRRGGIAAGQKLLIDGASGSVGVFAVQLAKHFGAHVTAVCSTANVDLVRSLGADEVVDYTRDDFTATGCVYDTVLDTVGKSAFDRHLRVLKRGGHYVRVGGSDRFLDLLGGIFRSMWTTWTGRAKVIGGVTRSTLPDQLFLKDLIEAGQLRTVIDRCYSLNEIVAAHRHAEGGHKRGHVVVIP